MTHSKERPKIFDRIEATFGIKWDDGYCVVWGDVVHSKYDIAPDLMAHEETHSIQQKTFGPAVWWETYLTDPSFRLSQELEAYKVQIKYLHDHAEETTRDQRRFAFDFFAKQLSGETYGHLITYKKAKELLK